MATADVPLRPVLDENAKANVCVIGAGIAGLTTAYLLAREGKSVVVVDDGPIAGGETGRTTAHLSNALDDRYFEIERLHGQRGARLAAESHTQAIDQIEKIVTEENIDCEFLRLDGYLFRHPGQDVEFLERELEAARRAGLTAVRMVDRAPLANFETGPCLCFPRQAQFHIVKYMAGLATAFERIGGRIFTRTHVEDIRRGEHPVIVSREGKQVECNHLVVATNTPINDWLVIHTKQEAYRTYVIGAAVPKGSAPRLLLWDTADPYHYVRMQPLSDKHDLLIIGGEDHKTGQSQDTSASFDRLESWARQLFPNIEYIQFRWSGQVMEPVDAMAFIGRNPGDENVFVITGDSGNGMTHGTLAGILIRDLIDNCDNPWKKLYEPSRKTLKSAGDFARANLNVARQYLDFVTGGQVEDVDEIPMGSGAVIRRGVQKVAAYRDDKGVLHEMSAICPHLGCIVDWNATESTWDCPCHGSRFTCEGKVINGPANSDLQPTEDDEPVVTTPITP
jgi:glycine/D-amino acid oxidase-like deaminating enzyme/nitrite reductase/ring-hydroxylating ferredoxin subunit